ncbi:MAG: hypothetical protein JJ693_08820 [Acidithiobacillus sp.]|nr:hypothetical protein [Acidithiobacillus sp.]
MFLKILSVTAIFAASTGIALASPVANLLNNLAVYGEYAGVTQSHGSSSGGIGGRLESYVDGFYGQADGSYTPGSLDQDSSGSSTDINLQLGYGLPIGKSLIIGPYLGYQYLGLTEQVAGYPLTFGNNSLGGGIFAAWCPAPRWGVQGHVGYLAGVSASVRDSEGLAIPLQAANLLDFGGEVDYRVSGPWMVFAGFHYAHYMEAGQNLNLLRGVFGAGLRF